MHSSKDRFVMYTSWPEAFGSCIGVDHKDASCQDLGFEHVDLEASVLHENSLRSARMRSATLRGAFT